MQFISLKGEDVLSDLSEEQRYWLLYNTHLKALKEGLSVDYSGLDTLRISIPAGAKSIPLLPLNDFAGVVFIVTNYVKDIPLFEYVNESHTIEVSSKNIDKGLFTNYPSLKKGKVLLSIKDNKPWVENREGYNYGHYRRDIILINNGMAENKTIMPYDNPFSEPNCKYYITPQKGITIQNITLNRHKDSKYKTFFCTIEGVDGLQLNNVMVNTPDNDWVNDHVLLINHCTNVSFNNLVINGTYSRSNHSGYGIELDNVWNFKSDEISAHGNWGVFGTNNLNNVFISNSDIDRFDIHCYGRDVSFKNVIFKDKYNQLASVYGTVKFEGCAFINFFPLINGYDYNSYVGYNLVFKDCEYRTDRKTPILVDEWYLDDKVNTRPELSKRCLPDVTIQNMTIHLPREASDVYLFFYRERGTGKRSIDYISNVTIDGLYFLYDDEDRAPANFILSNLKVDTEEKVKLKCKNTDLEGNINNKNKQQVRVIENFKQRVRDNDKQ